MEGLGSTDPELRDSLILEVFCTWVYEGRFAPDELRRITGQLLGNLKAGVGQGENDLVFLRTFSVLVLRWVVSYDAKAGFMLPEELRRIFEAGLQYLADEQDLRGFVPEKGWAHSVAHTADLLLALAEHPSLGAADLERLLHAISAKVLAPTQYPLVNNEGFRLAAAVVAALRREMVPMARVVGWLQELGAGAELLRRTLAQGQDNVRYHNAAALLIALHLMLTYQELRAATRAELLPAVYAALKSFMPWAV